MSVSTKLKSSHVDDMDGADPRAEERFCNGITTEKKYYRFEPDVIVKRNITRSEWAVNILGQTCVPDMPMERLKNEVAAIEYIRKTTDIPVPNIRCAFEDHGRFYIVMDLVRGCEMARLADDEKAIVIEEIEGRILPALRSLKSKTMGGLAGPPCLPLRLARILPMDEKPYVQFRQSDQEEFVFCHNDLSQYNIIVDPETLKIDAILDWEYAGFYPQEFEGAFYQRLGPSVALPGTDEIDDVPHLLEVYNKWKK